jgi:uncharacterized membrane protein YhaH (DUF805 family)
MGPAEAIRTGFARSLQFSGRASRSEFWWFWLFSLLVGLGVEACGLLVGATEATMDYAFAVVAVLLFLPFWAVAWRRLHDIGLSGMVNLIHLALPLVVGLAIFAQAFLAARPGDPFANVDAIMSEVNAMADQVVAVTYLVFALLIILTVAFAWLWSRPSDPHPNRYGPPPPGAGATTNQPIAA